MTALSALPVRPVAEPETLRLISTAYITEPALAPLADDDAALAVLAEIESLTSARQAVPMPQPDGLHPDELVTPAHGYGWTYVNAAFCYTRAGGNRFNGPERGAWYATYGPDAAQVAQSEVAFHLTRELAATGVFENTTCYRALLAGFIAPFYDLHAAGDQPFLAADPTIAYPAGQALARAVLEAGGNGVLYPSRRHPGGRCLAAFRPALVQNIRQGDAWTFTWHGSPTPTITQGLG